MRHLLKFNEKLGIDRNIESQCENIFKEINLPENKDKSKFNFYFKNNIGNFGFTLNISEDFTDDPDTMGQFSYSYTLNNFSINLRERGDKSTLLHELKHFDHMLRTKGNSYKNSDIYKGIKKIKQISDKDKQLVQLFYVFDEDEFQSKYHGYYSDIDSYIEKRISKNPTSDEITNLINQYLKDATDKTFTYYLNKKEFKFSDYGIDIEVFEKFLIPLIRDRDNANVTYENVFKELVNIFKWSLKDVIIDIKNRFGIATKSEKKKVSELVKKFEKDFQWKRKKYGRKFRLILTHMIEKYLNK